MFKKMFLLLLLSTNLCAISRLEDYNFSTVAMTTTIVGTVVTLSQLHAMDAEQRQEFITKLCSGDSEKINKVLLYGLIIATMTTGVLMIPITCALPIDLYDYYFPTVEQKIKSAQAYEDLHFLKTKENFRTCLFDSKKSSDRTTLNCPIHCQKLMRAFIKFNGEQQAIKMIDMFDKYWK